MVLRQMRSRHEESWGDVVLHIYLVQVNAVTARVGDCQDASGAGLADDRTHQLLPGTLGHRNSNLLATLTLGADARWRLSDIENSETPCSV
jgi:hypothetical protein